LPAHPAPVVTEGLGTTDAARRGQVEHLPGTLGETCRSHDTVDEVVDVHRAENAAPTVRQQELPGANRPDRLHDPGARRGTVDVAGPDDRAVHFARSEEHTSELQ